MTWGGQHINMHLVALDARFMLRWLKYDYTLKIHLDKFGCLVQDASAHRDIIVNKIWHWVIKLYTTTGNKREYPHTVCMCCVIYQSSHSNCTSKNSMKLQGVCKTAWTCGRHVASDQFMWFITSLINLGITVTFYFRTKESLCFGYTAVHMHILSLSSLSKCILQLGGGSRSHIPLDKWPVSVTVQCQ